MRPEFPRHSGPDSQPNNRRRVSRAQEPIGNTSEALQADTIETAPARPVAMLSPFHSDAAPFETYPQPADPPRSTQSFELVNRNDQHDASMAKQLAEARDMRSRVAELEHASSWVAAHYTDATIPRQDRDLTLVTRWPSQSKYSINQDRNFAQAMAVYIEDAAKELRAGRITTFSALWTCAVEARVATLTLHEAQFLQHEFKSPRNYEMLTRLDDINPHYSYISRELQNRLDDFLDRQRAIGATRTEKLGDISKRLESNDEQHLFINATLGPEYRMDDERYHLTSDVHFIVDRTKEANVFKAVLSIYCPATHSTASMSSHRFRFHVDGDEVIPGDLTHHALPAQNMIDALHDLHQTYGKALAADERDEILDHALSAYRSSVCLAPDMRGSASKSHFALQAILLAKGIALPPAAAGFAPDLEAMATPHEAWPQRARTIFQLQ